MKKLKMTIGDVVIRAELFETPTAKALWDAAPFTASASTWGDEVYFATPVSCAKEKDARTVIEVGELAFWLGGDSIAICFGPTPVSQGDESRLISPGNVFGKALDDVRQLRRVRPGAAIKVDRLED